MPIHIPNPLALLSILFFNKQTNTVLYLSCLLIKRSCFAMIINLKPISEVIIFMLSVQPMARLIETSCNTTFVFVFIIASNSFQLYLYDFRIEKCLTPVNIHSKKLLVPVKMFKYILIFAKHILKCFSSKTFLSALQ